MRNGESWGMQSGIIGKIMSTQNDFIQEIQQANQVREEGDVRRMGEVGRGENEGEAKWED